MSAIIGFSSSSQVSLRVDGGIVVCKRCRLGDSIADELVAKVERDQVVEAHIAAHREAGHTGADEASRRYVKLLEATKAAEGKTDGRV